MDHSDSLIATHQIIPGHLAVEVHDCSFRAMEAPVPCWIFVSRGLLRLGQQEIVLSIKRLDAERVDDYPRSTLELFGTLYVHAKKGRLVGVGHYTELTPEAPGLVGDTRLRGIAYAPPEPLVGVSLPSSWITAILLTQNELDAARQFGLVRLMSLLGSRYRHFPTAAWLERGRPDVTSPAAMSSSFLARIARMSTTGARAHLRGIETGRDGRPPTGQLENNFVTFTRQEVVLEVSAAAAAQVYELLGKLPQDSVFALITSPDPEADACLVWAEGSGEPTAITSLTGTSTRIAGNHVIFAPGQNRDEVKVFEDGFAVAMKSATWHEIGQLFANAPQNWGLPVTGPIGFRLKISA